MMFDLAHTQSSPSLGEILANCVVSNGRSLSGVAKQADDVES